VDIAAVQNVLVTLKGEAKSQALIRFGLLRFVS
jgi:hypothetical protein